MNRLNRVVTVGALVAAVGATVSLAFQPETLRPTQPGTPTTQPGTQPRDPSLPGRDPSMQPGRTPTLSQPGMNQGGDFKFQQGQKVSREQVDQLINAWPQESKKAAQATLEKYGPPDGGTFQELIWHDAGPWHKVVVSKEAHDHNFPMAHKDVLMGVIKFKVPQDKISDLMAFDGSLVINRTAGTIAAVCDKEEANFAALNLAHDIIQGSKSVEEAKDQMAKVAQGIQQGTNDPITQDFKFEVDNNQETGDPDQPHRQTPGMTPTDRPSRDLDRPSPTMPRTPGTTDPTLPRRPGTDPDVPRTPGTDPNRPTPPRDPLNPTNPGNPTPDNPTLPRRPGGG
ncbi:MAG TPA: hypothetical protein VD997_09210 [Phycisphaerales bacterium]|nr:hypothetical protein [Phycisphaerales bacterium]